jgi:foldase protein PrsA
MPKTKTKTKTRPKSQPSQRGRAAHQADREQWSRRLAVGGVVAVIAIVIGIIAYGWYQTHVKPLEKTVLQVEDTKFNLAHVERRVRLEKGNYTADNYVQLVNDVLTQLEHEGLLLAGAGEIGISVTDEEVTAEVRNRGNLAEDVEQSIFAAEFRRQVEESGLRENEYRQMLRADLIGRKVQNYFLYLAPTEEPQVRGRWIVLDDVDKADEVEQRLEAGEDFAALAKEFSIDTSNADQGGEFDWTPRGVWPIPKDVHDFLFDQAEIGQRSDVITVSNLYYIVELEERADSRPLDDQQRQKVADRNMQEWLADLAGRLNVKVDFDQSDLEKLGNDVF